VIAADQLQSILCAGVRLRRIEPGIYSVLSAAEDGVSYDRAFGTLYDRVACSRLYNRWVWGYSTTEYHSLCRDALGSSAAGWVLDAGCGSLAFTAPTIAAYAGRPVVLLDRSLKLLKIAKSRLAVSGGRIPPNIVLLHADVLQLPFKPGCFGTLIALNLLHVFADDDVRRMLQEMRRVLMDGGRVYMTTLIENRRLADHYLRLWGRAGELVPRNANRLQALLETLAMSIACRVRGNLAFITAELK
jgi:ubiquinone/menaquinone biosynthesis C-methylase UbiE